MTKKCKSVLHIASWYPNSWNSVEGNFVRDQIRIFNRAIKTKTVVVQVRDVSNCWFKYKKQLIDGDVEAYFVLTSVSSWKLREILSTLLLLRALIGARAWRFDVLHFHIGYPLLVHSRLWKWILRRPIIISEHWTAFHFNFYLPENARALRGLKRPFRSGFPVFSVSRALLEDIRTFSGTHDFQGFVVPNYVPIHGTSNFRGEVPVFFTVNVWRPIKSPFAMLTGLELLARSGRDFRLVIGGFGQLYEEMMRYVESGPLADRTVFPGKMTKSEIAAQLSESDAYLFSAEYETFSVACAEALGAGLPLIGPYIPAIAEYADDRSWTQVSRRDAESWAEALNTFIVKWEAEYWDRNWIASEADRKFSERALLEHYIDAMKTLGFEFGK